MKPDERIDELFLIATELDDAARAVLLDSLAPAVREKLHALLDADRLLNESDPDETTVCSDAPDDDDHPAENTSRPEAEIRKYLQPTSRPGWLGKLNHYEIEQIIGCGGFGIVVKAFDEKLHRVVAIKIMNPQLAITSPPRKRFLREARAAAAINHENIVAIHAVEEEPIPYIVMEFVAEQTLQQRLNQRGPLEPSEILRTGKQIAAGLAAAHAANLIHRDIKPANILLTGSPTDRIKISDFGLARAADDASLTASGMIAGSPMYMSPEQARGESLDHRSDLFSLGTVLYQMAAGRPPFRAANTVAVLRRVCDDSPRPLHDVIPETPDWLETIIFRLLEKERSDRYQTAQEVVDLIARCQSELEHNGKVTCVQNRDAVEDFAVLQPARIDPGGMRTWKSLYAWLLGGVSIIAVVIGLSQRPASNDNRIPEWPTPSSDIAPPQMMVQSKTPIEPGGWYGWPADAPPPAIAPFDANQAKAHQDAWAKYLGKPVEIENSIGMKLTMLPPGEFLMGTDKGLVEFTTAMARDRATQDWWYPLFESESPRHKVVLTRSIAMSKYEVTSNQFAQFLNEASYVTDAMKAGSGQLVPSASADHPTDIPVVHVSWNDAVAFCKWLSAKEGAVYRLPAEAEWEFACRAGHDGWHIPEPGHSTPGEIRPMDESFTYLLQYANVIDWSGAEGEKLVAEPVGKRKPNAFGLFDLHGNVWEWCQDGFLPYPEADVIDPLATSDSNGHILRGGAFVSDALECRPSTRFYRRASDSGVYYGFRVVRELQTVP